MNTVKSEPLQSKFCEDTTVTPSKVMTYLVCSSNNRVTTHTLPTQFEETDLDSELNQFREIWNNFKLHLHNKLSTNISSVVQSLFLSELEPDILTSSSNNLGLSTNELQNLDTFLLRFEDHCLPKILLKFEKFKSLPLYYELTNSNINHYNCVVSDHIKQKIETSTLNQTEDISSHFMFPVKDINETKSNSALQVLGKSEKNEVKNSNISSNAKEIQSETLALMEYATKNQEKCGNGIKDENMNRCLRSSDKNNSGSSEVLKKMSSYPQIIKREIKLKSGGDTCLTVDETCSNVYNSSKSEIILNQKRMTSDVNKRSRTRHTELLCSICGFGCRNTRLLKGHMKIHTNTDKHSCSLCNAVFKKISNLKSHLEVCLFGKRDRNREKSSTACSIILDNTPEQRRNRTDMKDDQQPEPSSSNDKLPLSCRMYSKSISGYSNSKSHLKSDIKYKQIKCDICLCTFPGLAKLKCHKLSHTREKPHKCNVCGTAFANKSHLNVHLRIHSGEKPFKCDLCQSSFSESTKLKNHKRVHTGEKPFVCQICGSSFTVSSSLRSHMKIHSNDKPFKCNVCDFVSSHSSNLKVHMLVHTGEKNFICDKCGASFTETAKLKRHTMVHTGERPYNCEVCGARFADKSHLTVHLRIHSGQKPFKCNFCASAFVESSKLKNHLRTHTGEKPYICEICGATFAVSYSLKSHMRRHTGEKPYKCRICVYATSQSSNLKSHMMVHNGAKPHICDLCGASFSELSKLNRHSVIHQDKKEECDENNAIEQNGDELDPNCNLKQNGNSWQELNNMDQNSTQSLKSFSHNSNYFEQSTDSSHLVKKICEDPFSYQLYEDYHHSTPDMSIGALIPASTNPSASSGPTRQFNFD